MEQTERKVSEKVDMNTFNDEVQLLANAMNKSSFGGNIPSSIRTVKKQPSSTGGAGLTKEEKQKFQEVIEKTE